MAHLLANPDQPLESRMELVRIADEEAKRLKELKTLGVSWVELHAGLDEQKQAGYSIENLLDVGRKADIPFSVAGGINTERIIDMLCMEIKEPEAKDLPFDSAPPGMREFHTTHWSMVLRAADSQAPESPEALEKLCVGKLLADVVAAIGSIDIVLGEIDR